MRQYIMPKQFVQLKYDKAIELFDLVPRRDLYTYHNKKITIGKILEVLEYLGEGNSIQH